MPLVKFVVFLFSMAAVASCKTNSNSSQKGTQLELEESYEQGIVGTVIWKSGNHMPTTSGKPRGKTTYTQRTVYAFPKMALDEVEQEGHFFINLPKEPIAKIQTNEQGRFRIELPTGTYSLFVEEKPGKFYANHFEDQGIIHPIQVREGAFAETEIIIDYQAAY